MHQQWFCKTQVLLLAQIQTILNTTLHSRSLFDPEKHGMKQRGYRPRATPTVMRHIASARTAINVFKNTRVHDVRSVLQAQLQVLLASSNPTFRMDGTLRCLRKNLRYQVHVKTENRASLIKNRKRLLEILPKESLPHLRLLSLGCHEYSEFMWNMFGGGTGSNSSDKAHHALSAVLDGTTWIVTPLVDVFRVAN